MNWFNRIFKKDKSMETTTVYVPRRRKVMDERFTDEGNSKEECQMKARQWYNEHVVQALVLAIMKIKEQED